MHAKHLFQLVILPLHCNNYTMAMHCGHVHNMNKLTCEAGHTDLSMQVCIRL